MLQNLSSAAVLIGALRVNLSKCQKKKMWRLLILPSDFFLAFSPCFHRASSLWRSNGLGLHWFTSPVSNWQLLVHFLFSGVLVVATL